MSDPRARKLDEMLEAARLEPLAAMTDAEAAIVLARVQARVRSARWRTRPGLWLAAAAAVLAALAVLVSPREAPPGGDGRIARETLIHLQGADGREVFIREVAYVEEN